MKRMQAALFGGLTLRIGVARAEFTTSFDDSSWTLISDITRSGSGGCATDYRR